MDWHEIEMFAVEAHHFCFDGSATVVGFYYALRADFGSNSSCLNRKTYHAGHPPKAFGARRKLLCI